MLTQENWRDFVCEEMLPDSHRKLVDVIGLEATLQLCDVFGGESVYIPRNDRTFAAVRAYIIKKEHQAGMSAKQLARKYGLSVRMAEKIVNG